MTGAKNFMFVVIILVVVTLIVGEWVIPVSADNTGIATPIITKIKDVSTVTPGNNASLEQQEELKNIIYPYFEARYHALSVLYSDDFNRNGFGDLVSDQADAKSFLKAELDKLAIEIKHAELNHLRYVQYEYFLSFQSMVVDESNQTAIVSLTEENNTVDEISLEISPEKPFVSHNYNRIHTIALRREENQWKIVSDDYMDYFWRMLRQTGQSPDELLRNMKAVPHPTTQSPNHETVISNSLPANMPSHAYDRNGAVDYAYDHANNYNPDYPRYDIGSGALPWGDCQNFVSQAIYEEGNASMYIPSPFPDPSPNGQSGWYLLNDMQRATDWNWVNGFYDFVTDPNPNVTEGPVGHKVDYLNDIMLGDVIQYDWTGDGTWDHSVIVVEIIGTDVYVATHTPDDIRHYTAFSPSYNPNLTQMRFIHIDQSRGNPPIKTKISAAGDDAGTVTRSTNNACGYTGTGGDYDVYFGKCFGSFTDIASGFQFRNLQIPHGAYIKYAFITFTVDGPYNVPLNLQINGENTGNPAAYSLQNPPGNRTQNLTGHPVAWNITDSNPNDGVDTLTWILGMRRTTPDLSAFVEAIVQGASWQSGNTLSIIFNNLTNSTSPVPVRRVIGYERTVTSPSYSPARLILAYTLEDIRHPVVSSILRASANPTNATSVNFSVIFSEPVTGVDASDFILTTTGLSGTSVTNVLGSGSAYTVTASTGTGIGALRLDVFDNDSIVDASGNSLGGVGIGNGNYSNGQVYNVRTTTFGDVPVSYWAWQSIERVYAAGITGGCSQSPLMYCPETNVTRAQIAVFLLRGEHGSTYTPPAVGGSTGFSDVPTSYWAAAWIKQLVAEGITGGCGNGIYCPETVVTRDQMAVLLLRAEHGSSYTPPDVGTSTGFADVPTSYWAAAWIKQLVAEGITNGCGGGNFCPTDQVNRAQMAVFLVEAFNLP